MIQDYISRKRMYDNMEDICAIQYHIYLRIKIVDSYRSHFAIKAVLYRW